MTRQLKREWIASAILFLIVPSMMILEPLISNGERWFDDWSYVSRLDPLGMNIDLLEPFRPVTYATFEPFFRYRVILRMFFYGAPSVLSFYLANREELPRGKGNSLKVILIGIAVTIAIAIFVAIGGFMGIAIFIWLIGFSWRRLTGREP